MRIRQHVPSNIKRAARTAFYYLVDAYREMTNSRAPMTPPAMTALLVGGGDFHKIGNQIKDDLVNRVGLHGSSRVLEIGCGYGRVAAPLTTVIKSPGAYDGTDVVEAATNWCTREITGLHPNFRFHHSSVTNPYAHSAIGVNAASYSLPFDDASYDVVVLTSVFSHMRPAQVRNYLSEISRVLRPGGYCYATYYLLNQFSLEQIASKKASQLFKYAFEDFLSTHKAKPEQTIAIDERLIRSYHEEAGLVIKDSIHYGSWANRINNIHYQDLIVARKA